MSEHDIALTTEPLAADQPAFAPDEGAEAQFLGIVRETEDGQRISGIDYTAYEPMALSLLRDLPARAAGAFHAPHRAIIRHRLGFVPAREPSIIIRVRAKHSAEAFDLCRWYLREIKTTVPIWKRPVFL